MPIWNPWKLMTIAMLLVLAAALVTGVIVANWTGGESKTAAEPPAAPRRAAPPHATAVPTLDVVAACNRYASTQVSQRDKTVDTVTDAAVVVGVGAGTLSGLSENRKHDERYREAYAGCLRSRGYAG